MTNAAASQITGVKGGKKPTQQPNNQRKEILKKSGLKIKLNKTSAVNGQWHSGQDHGE